MVYECEKCGVPLPAGVKGCPNCGEKFDDIVPADAEVPQRGFRPSVSASQAPPNPPPSAYPPPPSQSTLPYSVPLASGYGASVVPPTPLLARGWMMIITLLFCGPLFLIGVWQRRDWSGASKTIATVAYLVLAAVLIGTNASNHPSSQSSSSSISTNPSQSDSTPSVNTSPSPASTPDPPAPEDKPDLEVLNHTSESGEFARYITGTVRNNTDKTYSYAQVEINLYDKSGTQVGSTIANINNLAPHGLWKFKAIVTEDGAVRSEIKDVTGF